MAKQVTLTLSDKAFEEFDSVARGKGIPLATFLRSQLENYHQSPSFGNLYRRSLRWEGQPTEPFRDEIFN